VHRHRAICGGLGASALGDILIAETGRGSRQGGCVYLERRAKPGGLGVFVAIGGAAAGERAGQKDDGEETVQENSYNVCGRTERASSTTGASPNRDGGI
jgi:hypothetical protein